MCGGSAADYARAEIIIAPYTRICRRLGDVGAGQLAKMANQIAIAGLVQGLSECLAFAEKAGLNGRSLVEVISQGAAGSWQMVNRHSTMLDDHFEYLQEAICSVGFFVILTCLRGSCFALYFGTRYSGERREHFLGDVRLENLSPAQLDTLVARFSTAIKAGRGPPEAEETTNTNDPDL